MRLDALIRPRSVAVIGASAKRQTAGNIVIANLVEAGFQGRIVPVHHEADAIEGFRTVAAAEDLSDCDCAVLSVPAATVSETVARLDRAGVRSAIVMTAGFSGEEERALRTLANKIDLIMHGPNCMGLINVADSIPLYTAGISKRIRSGPVALVAQSGSAAISLMNSTDVGFSRIVTIGSAHRVTAATYLDWLVADDATRAVGVVAESIEDATQFAAAADRLHAAGKMLAVLKVGRSDTGAMAVQAHTGALIRSSDAFDAFFERHAIPTAADYDELIATLELAVALRRGVRGARIGIVGVSGGETALACDVAAAVAAPLAEYTPATAVAIKAALPDCSGRNPLDLGATVGGWGNTQRIHGILAVQADANVDMVMHVHDIQHSLPARTIGNYTGHLKTVVEATAATDKPVILVCPTVEVAHVDLRGIAIAADIPVLRGLRPGLVALRNAGLWATRTALEDERPSAAEDGEAREALRAKLETVTGVLPQTLCREILEAYGIPFVRSAIAESVEAAVAAATGIGFPVVIKLVSRDVPHRSEVGGVALGVASEAEARSALDRMVESVRRHRPEAEIEGFEIQEELRSWVEAMAGFTATPPVGTLAVFGTGGVLVELERDQAVGLCPLGEDEVLRRIAPTRFGKRLGGYRNLLPPTDLGNFARLVASLSQIPRDFPQLTECDLNPVLVRPGSGEVRVVDALFVAGQR